MRSTYILKISEEAFARIREWMLAVVAGHYLAHLDKNITTPEDFNPEEVLRIVKNLPKDKCWRHVGHDGVIGVRRAGSYYEYVENYKRLDWRSSRLFTEENLLRHLKAMRPMQRNMLDVIGEEALHLELRKRLLPFLGKRTPKMYAVKATKSFELDWSSFPYPVRNPIEKIWVELIFPGARHTRRTGQWQPASRTLQVDLPYLGNNSPSWARFQACMRRIDMLLRHELMHVSQTVMSSNAVEAGLPSPKTRSGVYSSNGYAYRKKRLIHALRDIEFYPRLQDEIQAFEQTGEKTREEIHRRVRERGFFVRLRAHQPDKWKIAVREFVRIGLRSVQ